MSQRSVITSLTNERVKAIRALEMRKIRKETGLFVAEGLSLLITARDHGFVPNTLVYQSGTVESGVGRGLLKFAEQEGSEILEVSEAVLGKLASKDNPQTMLGVFPQRFGDAPNSENVDPTATWLALEEVRDPGNLGTILRTADAAGCVGIIMIGKCCDPFSMEAIRASMGSIFVVPVVKLEHEAFRSLARRWPGDVVATHLNATLDFRQASYRGPELLLMGSEGPGLSDEVLDVCTQRVKIPMSGQLDSLNLATATALMLYQIRAPHLKL